MLSGRTKISPKSGRGLSHVTPKIFGIQSNISPKLLELETSNLVHGFVWRMTSRRTKISPKTGRGLGHVTHTIFGSTVGYPSDSLASCVNFDDNQLVLFNTECPKSKFPNLGFWGCSRVREDFRGEYFVTGL